MKWIFHGWRSPQRAEWTTSGNIARFVVSQVRAALVSSVLVNEESKFASTARELYFVMCNSIRDATHTQTCGGG